MPKVYFHDTGQLWFEITAGTTFKPDFTSNMKYVAGLHQCETIQTVIYDGPSFPPALLNIRDI